MTNTTTVSKVSKDRSNTLLRAFLPNQVVSAGTMRLIVGTEIGLALLVWFNSPFKVLPTPKGVFLAFAPLWQNDKLGEALATSFKMNLEALFYTALFSLLLAYLTVLPVFRPIVTAISKGRFLSMVGFSLVFILMGKEGHSLKIALLVFGMTVFFVTSMASVIDQIPKGDFDHARTLRMQEWQVVWEVVILGTADKAFEVLRQNAAIGWMMLTMVEGIVKAEGGVGVLLLEQQKYLALEKVFAIQIIILLLGLMQDYGIGVVRRLVCPYADLTLERNRRS